MPSEKSRPLFHTTSKAAHVYAGLSCAVHICKLPEACSTCFSTHSAWQRHHTQRLRNKSLWIWQAIFDTCRRQERLPRRASPTHKRQCVTAARTTTTMLHTARRAAGMQHKPRPAWSNTRYTQHIMTRHTQSDAAGWPATCSCCALQHTHATRLGWQPAARAGCSKIHIQAVKALLLQAVPPHEMHAAGAEAVHHTTQSAQTHPGPLRRVPTHLSCKHPYGTVPCTHRYAQPHVPPPTEQHTHTHTPRRNDQGALGCLNTLARLAAGPSQLHALHQHSQLQVLQQSMHTAHGNCGQAVPQAVQHRGPAHACGHVFVSKANNADCC